MTRNIGNPLIPNKAIVTIVVMNLLVLLLLVVAIVDWMIS